MRVARARDSGLSFCSARSQAMGTIALDVNCGERGFNDEYQS
jgi:hypothetical protein